MAILSTSIARKFAMALSGLFLVLFLAQHLTINFTSVISPNTFNVWSEFMGTNILVQWIMQPILAFAVIFHFVMGLILEFRNRNARTVKYKSFKGNRNSTWASRNMIVSGAVILAFLGLHFYDFWFPEMNLKYIEGGPLDSTRYYTEMVHKFADPTRTALYCLAFVLLMLHLWHGFSSSFQSIGWNNKYSQALKGFTRAYAIIVPLGFIFIALYLHFNGSH